MVGLTVKVICLFYFYGEKRYIYIQAGRKLHAKQIKSFWENEYFLLLQIKLKTGDKIILLDLDSVH